MIINKYKLINFDIEIKASFIPCLQGQALFCVAKPLQPIPFCARMDNVKLDNFLRR